MPRSYRSEPKREFARQRYAKSTGIGTLISAMLPYSVVFLVTWTALLLVW